MNAEELKKRTQTFALNIIGFAKSLPSQSAASILGRQLLRCGTSVGANYRAACLAKSRADFISKLKIVEEECDESLYWMELLAATHIGNVSEIRMLMEEARQLLSITVASIRTARSSIRK
jgi:four helix bundle protein